MRESKNKNKLNWLAKSFGIIPSKRNRRRENIDLTWENKQTATHQKEFVSDKLIGEDDVSKNS